MNSAITSSRQMKLTAGFAALAATLVITSATLALADSYARAAGDAEVAVAANAATQGAAAFGRHAGAAPAADLS